MKISIIVFCMLGLFSNISFAQSIVGQWDYTPDQMSFEFHPIQANGYGTYQVTYSNGYQYKDSYLLNGQQLGLARFNNGNDMYFNVLTLDDQQLVLQDAGFNQYSLTRKMAAQPASASATAAPAFGGKRYRVNSSKIVAQENGESLTEGDVFKNLQLLEFLLNAELNHSELQKFEKNCIEEFQKSPAVFLDQSRQAYTQMLQLYQLKEPVQVALAQSAMLSQIYPVIKDDPESADFVAYLSKYNRILSYDQANQLALTQQDVDGMINLSNFYNQLKGLNVDLTEEERLQMTQKIGQNFNSLPLDQKQSLCVMDAVYDYIYGSYQRMTMTEKEQLQQQIIGQQQSTNSGNNTNFKKGTSEHLAYLQQKLDQTGKLDPLELEEYKSHRQANQNYYTMLQNMQTSSHVTTMNIIENMGDSGDYWEVKYDNY